MEENVKNNVELDKKPYLRMRRLIIRGFYKDDLVFRLFSSKHGFFTPKYTV